MELPSKTAIIWAKGRILVVPGAYAPERKGSYASPGMHCADRAAPCRRRRDGSEESGSF